MVGLRLLIIAGAVFAITFVMFALAAVSPLDPLAHYLGGRYGQFTEAEREALARTLGVDKPWWQQLLQWWHGALHGDLGWSRVYHKPVSEVFAERLPWTVLLSGAGLLLMIMVALTLGLAVGANPTGKLARVVDAAGVFLAATPPFVYALGVITVFGVFLRAIPLGGAAPAGMAPQLGTVGPYLVAPALVLGVSQLSWPLLAMTQSARESAASPAVLGARMRGLPERAVVRGHIMPLSLMPLVTLLGARLGELVVGAIIVETVFSWPGLAQATVEAAVAVDFPLLAAITVATTVLVMLGSLLSDVTYLLLDPRVTDV